MTGSFRFSRHFGRGRWGRRDIFRLTGSLALSGSAWAAETEGGSEADQIWASYFRQKNVWAYIDKHSVDPGESFELLLSTGPARDAITGYVEFSRVNEQTSSGPFWRSPRVKAARQHVLRTAAATGANWAPILPPVDTTGWPPGCYSADFVEEGTDARDLQIAQVIVRNPRRSGAVLLKLCTNTYQAYNAWGGHSLYPNESDARGAIVSFDRPTGPAFFEYDVYLAQWLEEVGRRRGFTVDYASNFDVHREPDLLGAYALVACGAHDEYWSKEEFDTFESRIFSKGQKIGRAHV